MTFKPSLSNLLQYKIGGDGVYWEPKFVLHNKWMAPNQITNCMELLINGMDLMNWTKYTMCDSSNELQKKKLFSWFECT